MTDYAHVDPHVHLWFERSDAERATFILRDSYVPYARGTKIVRAGADIIRGPRQEPPRCMLVIGEPGFGKSTLLSHIASSHPLIGAESAKVVRINLPGVFDLHTFFRRLLLALHVPHSPKDKPGVLMESAFTSLVAQNVVVLMLDEFHNIFLGSAKALPLVMATIRDMTNTPRLSLICAGTYAAESCVVVDEQLDERFDRFALSPWEESTSFRNFVATFECRLPLRRPSNLSNHEHLPLLLRVTDGRMNRLVRVLREAGAAAVNNGTECIDRGLITETAVRLAKARPTQPTVPKGKASGASP